MKVHVIGCWAMLFLLSLCTVSCGPQTREISFTNQEPRLHFSILPHRDFFVVVTAQEAHNLAEILLGDPETYQIEAIRSLNFDQSFALIAYYGSARDSGFSIEIAEVLVRGQTVDVVVRTVEPCENIPNVVFMFLGLRPCTVIATQIVTYPNHIISINYADLPTTGVLTFNFRVNGELVKIIERELPPPAGE